MRSFLWSGKDVEGRERSERVEAENAQTAKVIVVQRGWTNLQLIADEVGDVVRKRLRDESEFQAPTFSPDEEASRLRGNWPSFAGEWWKATLQAKGICADSASAPASD